MTYDLIVIGGSPAGVSLAVEAQRAGMKSVLVLVSTQIVAPSEAVARLAFRHTKSTRIIAGKGGELAVEADGDVLEARACAIDNTGRLGNTPVPWDVPATLTDRIHTTLDFEPDDHDVLVVGNDEAAIISSWRLAEEGARIVLCFTGQLGELSRVAQQMTGQLEREQHATVLWQSRPEAVEDVGGFPMAVFPDRRTPDLQFDHILIVEGSSERPTIEATDRAEASLYLISNVAPVQWSGRTVSPGSAWSAIRDDRFPDLPILQSRSPATMNEEHARALALSHYNATITLFDTAHNELWRLRVRPDRESGVHRPGQYCSLGLGYWEPRADEAKDAGLAKKMNKLIRRSYSISSPVFDDHGYLADHVEMDEIELYIVWVQPSDGNVPALTPRLALKRPGDRIYLGPKVAGRYTLNPVTDPGAQVLFCATGTGEAPHNAMIVELLRKGHHGPVVSAVSVRYWSDLAYANEHRMLEERYPNYRYVAVPTREPDTPKRYMQDLLRDGALEEALGGHLSPDSSHVFMCGNPSMIGIPREDGGRVVFPESTGMAELLSSRGLTLDARGVKGNVHFEEYW